MKLKRTHHTDLKNLLAEIEQEEKARKAALTEAERAAEQDQNYIRSSKLYDDSLAWRKAHPKVLNPRKEAHFQAIVKDALWLAEECSMDVFIDQNDCSGIIQMETDYLLLDEQAPKRSHDIFARLFSQADSFSITHMPSTYIIEYIFELYDIRDNEEESPETPS